MSPRDSVPHFESTFASCIAVNNTERLKSMINRVKTINNCNFIQNKNTRWISPTLLYNVTKFILSWYSVRLDVMWHKRIIWIHRHSHNSVKNGKDFVVWRVRRMAIIDYQLRHVRLSVRPHGKIWTQLQWFSWNLKFEYFRKSVHKLQISLQSDTNNGYFTRTPIHIFDHISLSSS